MLAMALLGSAAPAIKADPGLQRAAAIPLPGEKCHTQGVAARQDRLFVSCVKKKKREAWIYSYSMEQQRRKDGSPVPGAVELAPEANKEVSVKGMYHPSGLDVDPDCLWVAVAHYRAVLARSEVMCLDPRTLEKKRSFTVKDHIGALASMDGKIIGLNWDARDMYTMSPDGRRIEKKPSPTGTAYQDCVSQSRATMVCSGPSRQGREAAVVDTLRRNPETGEWSLEKRTELSRPDVNLGREGFTLIDGRWAFVPEDFPEARLFLFTWASPDE